MILARLSRPGTMAVFGFIVSWLATPKMRIRASRATAATSMVVSYLRAITSSLRCEMRQLTCFTPAFRLRPALAMLSAPYVLLPSRG